MPAIEKLLRQLDDSAGLPATRRDIALAMLAELRELQTAPRRWNKAHFANAIAALGMNINALQQPTNAWLRLALVDLRKAMESARAGEPLSPHERHLDAVTIEELIATVESLGPWE
jgi:hypothetical protein